VKRLFEIEVPEVFSGAVEIKSIAREASHRTKVAVAARQEGIDPVGCCVGLRGIRIQNIVNELSGEKIDVVLWNSDAAVFIASALSPAQIVNVELNREEGVATVVVPDRQLSLAIGREGQNARLTAKLSGWRVDIKPVSVYEEEKAEAERTRAELEAVAEEKEEVEAEPVEEPAAELLVETEEEVTVEAELPVAEVPVELEALEPEVVEEAAEEEPKLVKVEEVEVAIPFEVPVAAGTSEIRFAEDIMPNRGVKAKKKKKTKAGGTPSQESEERGMKRVRRLEVSEVSTDDEDEL
jgi:N utilization substance protein A